MRLPMRVHHLMKAATKVHHLMRAATRVHHLMKGLRISIPARTTQTVQRTVHLTPLLAVSASTTQWAMMASVSLPARLMMTVQMDWYATMSLAHVSPAAVPLPGDLWRAQRK
jgi:hypothetical protein